MNQQETENLFIEKNALLKGHFKLSSGKHSDTYLQCALVMQYPDAAEKLCASIARSLNDVKIDVVAGPAMGGILPAYEMARALGRPNIFSERDADGNMKIRRGFCVTPGRKFLVTEDVVTTGGSAKELIDLITEQGGEVTAVACLVNRSSENPFDVPLFSALNISPPVYAPQDCPLCKQGLEIEKPGSRKDA